MDSLAKKFHQAQQAISTFERDFKLPTIEGSERQQIWARMIRRDFLAPLLAELIDAVHGSTAKCTRRIYCTVDEIRADRRAHMWINVYRHEVAKPLAYVFSRSGVEKTIAPVTEERERERQEKSQASRKVTKEAAAFEQEVGLAPLASPMRSTSQINFGRRCRLQMLRAASRTEVTELLPTLNALVHAEQWIDAFTTDKTLASLLSEAPWPLPKAKSPPHFEW